MQLSLVFIEDSFNIILCGEARKVARPQWSCFSCRLYKKLASHTVIFKFPHMLNHCPTSSLSAVKITIPV